MTEKKFPNWNRLNHAYGTASDIPLYLAQLNEGKEVAESIDALSNRLYHQGTIYSASLASIPILIELLKTDFEPKHEIVSLLFLFAEPYASKKYPSIADDENEPISKIERDSYRAIEKELSLFKQLSNQDDSPLNKSITELLTLFPQDGDDLLTSLMQKLKQKPTRQDLDKFLRLMRTKKIAFTDEHHALLLALTAETLEPRIIVRAATELIQILAENVPDAVISIFVKTVREQNAFSEDIYNALAQLPIEKRLNILIEICPTEAKFFNFEYSHSVACELLSVAFQCPAIRKLHYVTQIFPDVGKLRVYDMPSKACKNVLPLNNHKQTVIKALLQNPAFWSKPHNLFEVLGLPSSVEELQLLLEN